MDSFHTHSRRAVLGAGIAVAGSGLLATSAGASPGPHDRRHDDPIAPGRYVDPHGPEVADVEDRRHSSGRVRRMHLEARETRIDIGSRTVPTWAYGDRLPGDVLRLTAGDTLSMTFLNRLPQSTTLHWHGLWVRNDMDGVPDVTQRAIRPGDSFHYRFRVTQPGTYWMHPHVGVQQDRGLYAPLIVDDPREPLEYDHEWIVVLDDWLDGVDGSNPDAVLNELNHGRGSMHGGDHDGHDSDHGGHDSDHGRDTDEGHGRDADGGHGHDAHDAPRHPNDHGKGHDGQGPGHDGHGAGHGRTNGTSKSTSKSTNHATSHASSHASSHGGSHETGRTEHHVHNGDIGNDERVPRTLPILKDLGLDGILPKVDPTGAGNLGLHLVDKNLRNIGLGGLPLHGMTAATATAAGAAGAAAMARASRSAPRSTLRAGGPGPRRGHNGPSRLLPANARSSVLGGMPGSVDYPYHLINGRTKADPETFRCRPGDRIRIRFINAGGDTAYRVALGGHRMTVTHTDGNPVEHFRADQLLIGMAERYDVLVTAGSGVFPLVAVADGKGRNKTALALLRTGSGRAPEPSVHPRELEGPLTTADRLRAAERVRSRPRRPDRVLSMKLTGTMERFDWAINGRTYDPSQRYPIREGELVRLVFRNRTKMWHPMHLHGHSFTLPGGGPRKDTTIMRPGQRLAVEFEADNPGLWMLHCHNIYHSESGMMTLLGYQRG
ncbi:multicopper oxidase domain-containing protein [Streptomyces sp. 769]|uniref:multicopper oxidase domain-containing protein n=1 Tax=Streptomyces sp. 769 TaxID=1262452 RepID=UPI00057F197E|nr:multicopper oxidase domain-containing protein [Streptomyces sp. 769]AJC58853.1 putative multicopper oxidase [Streptomyces sp. 769]